MSKLDEEDQRTLKQQFAESVTLLQKSGIHGPEKRFFIRSLLDVQEDLANGADAQAVNSILLTLPVLISAMKYALHQEEIAGTDPLTGIANRRSYEKVGDRTIAGLNRKDIDSAALFIVDVKNFRDFNNNYGHDVGDKALKKIVEIINGSIRDTDFLARTGGDEFAIIASHKDESHDFRDIRKHIYTKFKDAHIEHEGERIPLVVTIGLTNLIINDSLIDAAKRADRDMYIQKEIQKREIGKNIYGNSSTPRPERT
ncbi:MAG: GGDEF domain-containing protein [Alphaproteobacteria bacterium]|nr:GGDEF domain-containing protein [Alphaproteobacteria bacterium]